MAILSCFEKRLTLMKSTTLNHLQILNDYRESIMKACPENNRTEEFSDWRDIDFYDVTYHNETIIDSPLEKVWHHLLKIKDWWNDDFNTKTISGEEGKIGYTVRTWPPGITDAEHTSYHYYKIISLIPTKLVTLKTYSAKGGSYGNPEYISFETFLLTKSKGQTKVSFVYNSEYLKHGKTIEKIHNNPEEVRIYFDERYFKFWENLRKLIEKSNATVDS